jgi:hypothetical protein
MTGKDKQIAAVQTTKTTTIITVENKTPIIIIRII